MPLNKPAPCIAQEENVDRTKRMSRSPHHTQQCKAPKPSSCPKKSGVRRSFPLGIANENVVPTKEEQLRIDLQGISKELTTLEPQQQQKTEFNVLEKDPNAQVKDRTPTNAASRSLIKSIVKGNWKTVTNILLLKVNESKPYVQQALGKLIGNEFRDYCRVGKSILRKKLPKELVEFSNAQLVTLGNYGLKLG